MSFCVCFLLRQRNSKSLYWCQVARHARLAGINSMCRHGDRVFIGHTHKNFLRTCFCFRLPVFDVDSSEGIGSFPSPANMYAYATITFTAHVCCDSICVIAYAKLSHVAGLLGLFSWKSPGVRNLFCELVVVTYFCTTFVNHVPWKEDIVSDTFCIISRCFSPTNARQHG